MSDGPEQHAATVRAVLPGRGSPQVHVVALAEEWADAHEALDELVARANFADAYKYRQRAEAAEARARWRLEQENYYRERADELQRERDEWKGKAEFAGMPAWEKLWNEKEQARREADQLREEARKGQEPLAHLILDATTILRAHRIARAVLAGVQAEGQRWPTKADDRGASSPPTPGVQADNKDSA